MSSHLMSLYTYVLCLHTPIYNAKCAESVFELLNSHGQKRTLNNPIEIQMQSTLEEDVEPERHPEPKKRTVPVAQWTEGLGLIEAGTMVFEHIDWNVQPAAAATGRGIVGHLLIMGRF